MVQLTNTSQQNVSFTTGVKDGKPEITDVKPGETKDVNVREDDPTLVGHAAVGAIVVGNGKGKAAARTAS